MALGPDDFGFGWSGWVHAHGGAWTRPRPVAGGGEGSDGFHGVVVGLVGVFTGDLRMLLV